MNIRQWLEATNGHKRRLTAEEKERRRAVRRRVLEQAGTTYASIRSAVHRNSIGHNLLKRLEDATASEREQIRVVDEWPEHAND